MFSNCEEAERSAGSVFENNFWKKNNPNAILQAYIFSFSVFLQN